jgi:hypothetical protein
MNVVDGFQMPVDVTINGNKHRLNTTDQWQAMDMERELTELIVDPNYYVGSFNLLGR